MIQATRSGLAVVVKRPDGKESIMCLYPKEASTEAEYLLKSDQERHPEMSFRLINVTIDLTEVQ